VRRLVILFSLAGIIGFTGARLVGGKAAALVAMESDSHRRAGPARLWETDDLARWARTRTMPEGKNDWQEWSDEELRAAMDLAVKDPGMALGMSSESQVLAALFEESLKRDFDGAIDWFEGLVADAVKRNLGPTLAVNWPEERAAEGLEYVIANRDFFETGGGTSSGPIIKDAIEAAAKRGAAELDALFGKLRENQLDPRYADGWEFPENFDFKGLMEGGETRLLAEKGNLFFAGIWMRRDREAAFGSLVMDGLAKQRKLPNLFYDLLPTNGEALIGAAWERARWLGGKLGELPDQRQEVGEKVIRDLVRSPAAMADFTQALADESDRLALSTEAMRRMVDKGPEQMLEFLAGVDQGELGMELLRTIDVLSPDFIGRKWRLDEALEAMLRKKLTAWEIAETRADEIVENLKSRPR
jgi:hypothetical protein